MTVEARPGTGGRRLPTVIALHSCPPDDRIGPFAKRVSDQKFIVPRLVPPHGEPRAIIAFDPDARNFNCLGETGQILQRRRQMGQAIPGNSGEQRLQVCGRTGVF